MGFIYMITNTNNNKKYISKTSYTIEDRWKEHCKNFHYLRDNMPIHKAMLKYGIKSFSIIQIEECDNEKLNERE